MVVQGDGQAAQAGRDLPTPIVLRVLDSSGVAVSGVTISLSVATGGGAVTPASDTTDARGEFKTKWTLGPSTAQQSILVMVAGGRAGARSMATGFLPSAIVLVQGNNQTAKTGSALANSIIVRVIGGVERRRSQGVTSRLARSSPAAVA